MKRRQFLCVLGGCALSAVLLQSCGPSTNLTWITIETASGPMRVGFDPDLVVMHGWSLEYDALAREVLEHMNTAYEIPLDRNPMGVQLIGSDGVATYATQSGEEPDEVIIPANTYVFFTKQVDLVGPVTARGGQTVAQLFPDSDIIDSSDGFMVVVLDTETGRVVDGFPKFDPYAVPRNGDTVAIVPAWYQHV